MLSKGIGYIMLATLAFAFMNFLAKALSDFHPMQVVFFRAFGTFALMFPYMILNKISILGNNRKLLLARSFFGMTSLILFFIAIQRIPLGSAISIRYLGPIFGAGLAIFYLKEKVNGWQWISFLIAFCGVILLKGFDLRIDYLSFFMLLLSALLVGIVFVFVRKLTATDHHLTIINYFMTMSVLVSICFVSTFRMPSGVEWWYAIAIGIFGLMGQVFMTLGFKYEEASVLAPFKYLELVYAMGMGFLFLGETYTLMPLIGIAMIVFGMIMNVKAKGKQLTIKEST